MIKSKFSALAAVALALLILAPATLGAAKIPPNLQDIVGAYDVKLKYTGYDEGPDAFKGSFHAVFTIEQAMGPGNVLLTWYSDFGASWEYPALYQNGVLVFATSDDEKEDPPLWIDMMIAQFSGSGDKIKMSGSTFIYDLDDVEAWAEEDSFTAKMIPE